MCNFHKAGVHTGFTPLNLIIIYSYCVYLDTLHQLYIAKSTHLFPPVKMIVLATCTNSAREMIHSIQKVHFKLVPSHNSATVTACSLITA
jgi:hypothetical protein